MPSKTLLLVSLMAITSYFQGTLALPASSTSPLTSETTNSFGSPLSSSPKSTTVLGEPKQATPTAVVPLVATLNSTSEPSNSGSHMSSRGNDVPWVGFYNNADCEDTRKKGKHRIGDITPLEMEDQCYIVYNKQTKARYMKINTDIGFIFNWYTEDQCTNHVPDPKKVDPHSTTVNPGGICRPNFVDSIQSMSRPKKCQGDCQSG